MTNGPMNRKLKMGIVGGGQGSFIGRVHSIAACLDNRATLVAGAFSSNADRSKASAPDYDVSQDRAYPSYQSMFESEAKKPVGERIDFVSVTTPNHTHFEVAKAALEAGFHVVCDKPMTFDLAQAEELAKLVDKSKSVFALTPSRPIELYSRLVAHAIGRSGPKASGVAHRSKTEWCGRLLWRHRNARLQFGAIYDGATAGRDQLPSQNL
jgi:hypothetical protein